MAETDQDQKTEKPTGKHLSEAIENGQFARAPEITVVFTMAAVLAVIAFTAKTAAVRVGEYASTTFGHFASYSVRTDTMGGHLDDFLLTVGPVLAPVLAACACAALLAGGIQSGFNLTPKALAFKWDRLNPVQGLGNVFSKQKLIHGVIDLFKVAAIGLTLWAGARQLIHDPLFTAPIEAEYLMEFIDEAARTFFGRMLFAIGVLAAISYAYEKFKTSRDLMMTREEVKEEHKQQEGDAKVKGAQRRMARRLLQKQMLEAVATADVVVTNPTHYAVALKYERDRDVAPVVLAKGEGRFALRLKGIAAEHGVPTIENKPVARFLFAVGRVGESIPPELYQAVAEILAVVYRTHRYYFYRLRARRLEASAA
ncbi:MAG: EscU/YscU/HrcU family type III secretion system export apparatus switch protein [Opitutaceae bacterium]